MPRYKNAGAAFFDSFRPSMLDAYAIADRIRARKAALAQREKERGEDRILLGNREAKESERYVKDFEARRNDAAFRREAGDRRAAERAVERGATAQFRADTLSGQRYGQDVASGAQARAGRARVESTRALQHSAELGEITEREQAQGMSLPRPDYLKGVVPMKDPGRIAQPRPQGSRAGTAYTDRVPIQNDQALIRSIRAQAAKNEPIGLDQLLELQQAHKRTGQDFTIRNLIRQLSVDSRDFSEEEALELERMIDQGL